VVEGYQPVMYSRKQKALAMLAAIALSDPNVSMAHNTADIVREIEQTQSPVKLAKKLNQFLAVMPDHLVAEFNDKYHAIEEEIFEWGGEGRKHEG